MSANEEELLSEDEKQKIWVCGEGTLTAICQAQVAKLKAMGYEQVWIKCPECLGTGVARDYKFHKIEGTACPTCKGTGRIYKKVKWDREKVARVLALQTLGDDDLQAIDRVWEWVVKNGYKDEYYDKADQLKEILTGGEE